MRPDVRIDAATEGATGALLSSPTRRCSKAKGRDTSKDNPRPLLHSNKDESMGTLPYMGESTGDENANLYIRGVNEGSSGGLLEASDLLDILEVFGEDGMRSYLMGVVEGQEDAAEDEQDGED
jgi:hypothetical protein